MSRMQLNLFTCRCFNDHNKRNYDYSDIVDANNRFFSGSFWIVSDALSPLQHDVLIGKSILQDQMSRSPRVKVSFIEKVEL